jgi:hypothetical protein
MPIGQDCRANRLNRSRSADPDQDNHHGGHRDGRGRVHDDAQRAVIGVGVEGVDVRHLHHGQKREQDEAHQSNCARCTGSCAALSADLCLQSGQMGKNPLTLRYTL